ncbi:MAG: biopolymer transporter ExbD [Magnetococcales bacterium]|nr:biopolymer transporter ExbD [Magnetococcales bacterium]
MAGGLFDADGEDRPLAEINVTPLVDVMLVLLVIFIILAPAMANSLRVTLPKAKGERVVAAPPVTITVQADGSMQIGAEVVDEAALAERLRRIVQQDPESVVRIDGDGAVPYQRMAQLLALVQEQRIHKIAFTTRSP